MQTEIEPGVVVIGAGVVGLSAAIAAQARGLAVTVLERRSRRPALRPEMLGRSPSPISCRSPRLAF